MVVEVIDAPWAGVPARIRWHNTALDVPRNHLPDGDIPGPQREGVRTPGASGCAGDKNDSAQLSRQIRLARSGSYDVVTLASRDTDLALPLMKHTNYRPQRLKRQSGTTPPTGERLEV